MNHTEREALLLEQIKGLQQQIQDMNDYIDSHAQAPTDPADGDTFTCPRCGLTFQFVLLDDGLPGEWVEVSNP